MPSKVDVANWALDRIGAKPIVSFDDNTPTANYVKRLYPLCRDELFRKFSWRCLVKRVELSADTTAPAFGYLYRYLLPSGCLFIREVRSGDTILHDGWEREGDYILTDYAAPLRLLYTYKEEDPNKWDSLLVSTVAAYLSYTLAEPITQSPEKIAMALRHYDQTVREAKFVNAQEGTRRQLAEDSWHAVRRGGAPSA